MSRFSEHFRKEGMQQGMWWGRHQGKALVPERQLRLKLGVLLPEEYGNGSGKPASRACCSAPDGSSPPTVSTRFCTEREAKLLVVHGLISFPILAPTSPLGYRS